MAKQSKAIFDGNVPFNNFRKALSAAGVHVAISRTLTSTDKGAPCAYLSFIGEGFQPAILDAVAFDWGGESGFGLYYPAKTPEIADDVKAIIGDRNRA